MAMLAHLKFRLRHLWGWVGFTVLSAVVQANPAVTLSDAAAHELAMQPQWLKLGHYQPSGLWRSVRSAIHSDTFFLASSGRTDPVAELQETLAALQAPHPNTMPDDAHAQCRFPARYLWLREQLPELAQQPVRACQAYSEWAGGTHTAVQSASLIFIEGYLGNPSSFFGHVLLRLNRDDGALDRPQLLATTLNFGVDLPSGEDPLLYFWRGTTGGYDAVFTQAQFHQHQLLYGDFQHRDLWEYRLALTPEQVALLTAHSWELLGQDFRYFFTGANCAYRTASVLAVVLPTELSLSNSIKPWTMPHDTFAHLIKAEQNGAPLVQAVYHHPAQNTERVLAWQQLTAAQRQAAQQGIRQPGTLPDHLLSALTPTEQAQVLDVLLLDQSAQARFVDAYPASESWLPLLNARAALPVLASASPATQRGQPQPVHKANLPTRIALSGVWQEAPERLDAELQLRVNYYDLLSRPLGRPALGELVLLDARLGGLASDWQWRRLDLMRVTALNVSPSGLWQDQSLSGRFRVGYDYLGCADCGTWLIEGGPGLAWGRPQHYAFYTFIQGRLNTSETGPVAITPQVGWLHHWHPALSTHLEAGYRWAAQQGDWGGREVLTAGIRYGQSARWDVRLNWRAEGQQHWQLEWGTYW